MKRSIALVITLALLVVGGVATADHGGVLEHIDNTTALLDSASSEFTAGDWDAGQALLTQADAELQLARAEEAPGPNLIAGPPPPSPPGPEVGTTIKLKIGVFKPVVNGSTVTWVPLACDGSDVISGVGEVRFVAYARNTGTTATTPRLRVTYNIGEHWYQYVFPKLQPGGAEVAVYDAIQDLDPTRSSYKFHWEQVSSANPNIACTFTATNIPAPTGFKSHRTTAGTYVQGLTITIRDYGTGVVIPCGGTSTAPRIKVSLEVDTQATPAGTYDFHMHVESGGTFSTGPDQDGNPMDRRYWEAGFHDVPVPNNNSAVPATLMSSIATNVAGNRTTVHFAQQTAEGQVVNEVFCSFTRA